MGIKLRIKADNENEFRRYLTTLAEPYMRDILEGLREAEGVDETTPPPPPADAAATEPAKRGRPRGSTKARGNGGDPQTAPPPNGAATEPLSLAEQIQIITDAAHDQPDRLKPLLVPLREKIGVQYVSKASEKDRPALQEFINTHGLAV